MQLLDGVCEGQNMSDDFLVIFDKMGSGVVKIPYELGFMHSDGKATGK